MTRFAQGLRRAAIRGTLAASLAALAACDGHSRPPAGPNDTAAVAPSGLSALAVLSEPVAVRSSAAARTDTGAVWDYGAGSAASVAYVSLPPGSVPGGTVATIRNAATGQSRSVPATDGGFDPVALLANVGDAIVIEVSGAGGAVLASARLAVPPARPPTVVRTDPPKGKTDVQLNGRMEVVFSEPIDRSTLTTATVQLFAGSTSVAGTVQIGELGLTAAFVPDKPLDPATEYRLMIAPAVRDQNGESLAAAVTVPFTTSAAPPPGVAAYTIAMAPSELSIPLGAQGTTVLAAVPAAGFADDVAFSVAGAPPGVTITLDDTRGDGSASMATVVVSADAASGEYPITVRATAPGVPEQVATLTLTVTSSPPSGNTTACLPWLFYELGYGRPVFFAYQDGDGPWTAVAGTGERFTFNIASGRGAFARVSRRSATDFYTELYYGTQAELDAAARGGCSPESPRASKTVYGRFAGVGAGQTASVNLYGSSNLGGLTTESDFILSSVPDAPADLVAMRFDSDPSGRFLANAGIIRRDYDPAPNSTMPVLDFESAEAFQIVRPRVTIAGMANDDVTMGLHYRTAGGTGMWLASADVPSRETARQYPGVPATRPGDTHELTLSTYAISGQESYRTIKSCFTEAGDRTVTLPPHLGAVTVSAAAGSPYARLRLQYQRQPEYNGQVGFDHGQSGAGGQRVVWVTLFPGYLGAATAVDLTTPDFTGLRGWNAAWGLRPGLGTIWEAYASGATRAAPRTGELWSPCRDGDLEVFAVRTGAITP